MRNRIIPALTLLGTLTLMASQVHAAGLTIIGSLTSKRADVSLPNVTGVVADVKPVQFTASQGGGAGCALTVDVNAARNHNNAQGDLLCLFEWILPDGLMAYADGVAGIVNGAGDHVVSYQVSIFSGSTNSQVVVETGSTTITAAEAIAPVITNYVTTMTSSSQSGEFVTSYKKGEVIENISVSVEARPFDQRIMLDGMGVCEVPEGQTSCGISVADIPITTSLDEEGANTYVGTADSLNGFFQSQGALPPHFLNVGWDYRPPTVDQLIMQAVSPGNEQAITETIGSTQLIVGNEKALVIVTSPHEGLDGTWWHPDATLNLKPDPAFAPQMPEYSQGGQNSLDLDNMISLPTGDVTLTASMVSKVEGKWVFEYGLGDVPDGVYIPTVRTQDGSGNFFEGRVGDNRLIDRKPPEVRIFTRYGRVVTAAEPIYFFENLLVAAVDSMSGAGEVVSATVDGIDILGEPVREDFNYLKMLRAANYQLEPNREVTLNVVVRDPAGNVTSRALPVRYMPAQWKLDDLGVVYQRATQRISFPLRMESGPGCRMYSSLSAARNEPHPPTYRCAIEWISTPAGTSGAFDGMSPALMGIFDNSTSDANPNTAQYKIWLINKDNVEALAQRGEQQFDVVEPKAPVLSYNALREALPGVFLTEVDGGYITSTGVEFKNGDLRYTVDTGESTTVHEYTQSGYPGKNVRMSRTLSVEPAPLWTDRNVVMTAQYMGEPGVQDQRSLRIIHAPSRSIVGLLEGGDVVQTNNLQVPVHFQLGKKDFRTRAINYDQETMGQWTVRLAKETRSKDGLYQYDYLTEAQLLPDDGKLDIQLDLTPYSSGGHRFVVLAEVQTPIPEAARTIKSNAVFYQIYKGGAIAGDISLRRIAGKVPFAAQLFFVPNSTEDRMAKGRVDWEMSRDEGATWVSAAENRDFTSIRLDEAGLYQFRAKVTNRFTGKIAYTQVQEVLAYLKPDLGIQGPFALHPGESIEYTLTDGDAVASTTDAEIQWSTDGGVNWSDGNEHFVLTMGENNVNLMARMAYLGNSLAGDQRWATVRRPVRKAKLAPVRVALVPPQLMEYGETYEITPRVSLADNSATTSIRGKWILPDGTEQEGMTLTYTPSAAVRDAGFGQIEFDSWAEGYYTDTLTRKTFTFKAFEYEFPSFELAGGVRTPYAPAYGVLVIPTPMDMPPAMAGIQYTTAWTVPSTIETIRETDKQLVFNVTEAGVHRIRAVVEDSRGGLKAMEILLSVESAPEPDMNIVPLYSNTLMREPLMVTARLGGALGHPLDRIASVTWAVDGVEQTTLGSYIIVRDLMAGQHQLTAKMTTKFGIYREYTMPLLVVENHLPTCESMETHYSTSLRLDMKCTDEDGRVSKYEWTVNGEVVPYAGSYIFVSKTAGTTTHIAVRGVDDSGEYSNTIEQLYAY